MKKEIEYRTRSKRPETSLAEVPLIDPSSARTTKIDIYFTEGGSSGEYVCSIPLESSRKASACYGIEWLVDGACLGHSHHDSSVFPNRPMKIMPCSHKVPKCAEQYGKPPDQTRPVHIDRSDFNRLGPKREEEGKSSVHEANNVG